VKRVLGVIIFLLVAVAFFSLLHVSVGLFFVQTLPAQAWCIALTLAVCGVVSIGAFLLNHWKHNAFSTVLYWFGAIWMGSIFIAFLVFFPLDVLLFFGVVVRWWVGVAVTAALIATALLCAFVPRAVHVTIPLKGLRKQVKMVQISDVHIGAIYGPGFLTRVVQLVNKQKPAVVVITGDLFDGAKFYDGMIAPLNMLKTPAYFISGNHELYAGMRHALSLVRQTPVTILEDRMVVEHGIQLAGVHYELDNAKTAAVIKRLGAKVNKKLPSVLLRHVPADIAVAAQAGFSLQLSGHTHNGQIWPLSYLVRLAFPYRVGLHQHESMALYISPGTGSWGPPLRLGSRSEVTVLHLVPA
jgi:uncharacterized protein